MIGFPTVLQLNDIAQNNCIAFCFQDREFIKEHSVAINIGGETRPTNFSTLIKDASLRHIDGILIGQKRTLELSVRAHTQKDAEDALQQLFDGTAVIDGESASLALHIASQYRIGESTCPTLFSGLIRKNMDPIDGAAPFIVASLSGTEEGMDGLEKKLQFVATWQDCPEQCLYLFDSDYQELAKRKPEDIHRLVSLRPDDFPNLSNEVRERACLDPLSSSEPNIDGQNDYKLESMPTFKDLLLRALSDGDDETEWAEKARSLIEVGKSKIDQGILSREISETFELQHKVWNNEPQIFGADEDKLNLLISGPTGSGKTALIDILILRTIIVHQSMCIYLAPTRALTFEFFRKFVERYENFLAKVQGEHFKLEDEVVFSTGEQGEFDGSIRACNVSLACMVNEKANVLLAAEGSKLIGKDSRLGLVIIDELHMMQDAQRGGVLDLLLSKLFYFQSNQQISNRSLRITGITTEATVSRLVRFSAFDIDEEDELQPPIELSTTKRPVPVAHKVVLKVPKTYWPHEKIPEVDLCNFIDTNDRQLEQATVRPYARQLAKFAGSIAPKIKSEKVNFETTISHVIVHKLASHRIVLVAMASAELIEPARQVKNAIDKKFIDNKPDEETSSKFKVVIKDADLDDDVRKSMEELAQRGVFIHSSKQPQELRHFIEETFSRAVPGDWKAVIFTTETLSFGVNLAVNCIVLGQIDFPRDIDGQDGLQTLPLRPNAFHNLLGRAGRYDFSENKAAAPAEAIVMLDAVVYNNQRFRPMSENDFLDKIKLYYTKSPDNEQFSALLKPNVDIGSTTSRSDLQVASRRQRNDKKYPNHEKDNADEAYSYASLRACCDILRFLSSQGVDASSEEVVRFIIEHSVFGTIELAGKTDPDSEDWKNKEVERNRLKYAVDELLEALVRDDLKLLDHQENNTFHVTDRAGALIDTGVRPSAIKPIRTTLEIITRHCDTPNTRVPLLLIAFCATPEFWTIAAREFCEDACGAYNEDSAGLYVDFAKELFLSEIDKLQPELDRDIALRVADDVFKSAIKLKHLYLYEHKNRAGEDVKKAVFFKLCAVTLRWLRGASYNEITSLYPKNASIDEVAKKPKKAPTGFASKYAEKLGWLSDATHKFFGDDADLMPSKLKVEVKLLGERCRRGLPGDLIPFSESYYDGDGDLHPPRTRTQTIALIDTKLSKPYDYSAADENSTRARSYFKRSFRDNLAATLELEADFSTSIQQQIVNNNCDLASFMPGLVKSFGSNNNQLFTVNFYHDKGVIWLIDDFRVDLLLPEAIPQDTGKKRVILRLVGFWGDLDSENGLRISVFGAIVLAAMIKRNLLSYRAFGQIDSYRFISVAEIVSELSDADQIQRLGCFEEQLLSFREPASLQ